MLSNNSAKYDGGGIALREHSHLALDGARIRHNRAGRYGGGVIARASTLRARGASLVDNRAGVRAKAPTACSGPPRGPN